MVLSDNREGFVSRSTTIISIALGALSLIVTALVYSRLPETVPVHWNVRGEVDNYGPRSMAWVLGSLPIAIAALMRLLPAIDPRKQNYLKSARAYNATMLSVVTVMVVVQFLVVSSAIGIAVQVDAVIKAVMGLLFLVIGNFLGTVRSTFFFGIRTPWTLSNDEVWRKTHRLGGVLFMVAGLAFLAVLFIRNAWAGVIPLVAILAAVVVPVVYSWVLYRKLSTGGTTNRSTPG